MRIPVHVREYRFYVMFRTVTVVLHREEIVPGVLPQWL